MLKNIRRHLTYANVVSSLCLFFLLAGGTAYATHLVVNGSDVVDESLTGADIKGKAATATAAAVAGTLAGADVLDNSLTGTDITESTLGKVPSTAIADKLILPEPWRAVAAGSTTANRCADLTVTAVFCSEEILAWSSWVNYGGGYATAGFYKDQLGIVHLKGLVMAPLPIYGGPQARRRPIFRLPATYRPTTLRVFSSVGSGRAGSEVVAGRIDVEPNGLVDLVQDCNDSDQICSAIGGYVTLDGITFRPDA